MDFSLFSETTLETPAPPGLHACCPTLDLSVSCSGPPGNQVVVYRPPGQVVSRIHQGPRGGGRAGKDVRATAVKWKPDGQFIAVGWNDGHVRIMGLENNKAAHSIRVAGQEGPVTISHIGWTRNRVGRRLDGKSNGALAEAWEHLLGNKPSMPDLPKELMFLEIDSTLPKISPLPSGSVGSGEDAMVFTLRTGIDFLFQDFKPEDSEEVSVMVVGTEDGGLHLSIYDSFSVGTFTYDSGGHDRQQLVHHASHPDLSTHSLLFKSATEKDSASVDVVPLDLSFILSSPINLSLLASKLTTLQKLLRYLKQTLLHMQVELKNTRELPTKYLALVQDTLLKPESPGPKDVVASLYHTAVTGHVYAPVKEFLIDSLAERGHKRWDKAVMSGLENLRALLHENYLPALDRIAIILSRLKGLAQFHASRSDTGLSAVLLSRLADAVGCLTLVGHRSLLIVMEELDHFRSFSAWLRLQIDKISSSNSNSGGGAAAAANDELADRDVGINLAAVLTYLRRYLVSSPVEAFLGEDKSGSKAFARWDEFAARRDGGDGSLMAAVADEVVKERQGLPFASYVCRVSALIGLLDGQAGTLFEGVAEAQKRTVRLADRTRIRLGGPIRTIDMRMGTCEKENGSTDGVIYTAATTKNGDHDVFLFKTTVPIVNGISSKTTTHVASISLPHAVVDVRFLNPTVLLVLLAPKGARPKLARIPVAHEGLKWSTYEGTGVPVACPLDARSIDVPTRDGFTPVEMEVHPSADVRGPVPGRVCLLGSNRTSLCTFELRGA